MPARGYSTNRQPAVNRQTAVGRAASVGRLYVQGTASADDMIFIASIALDSVQTFSAIPGTYRHLRIEWIGQSSTVGAKEVRITFNADGTTNYDWNYHLSSSTTVTAGNSGTGAAYIRVGRMPGSTQTGFASGLIELPYYALTVNRKASISFVQSPEVNDATGNFTEHDSGSWRTANAAITSITFAPDSGAFTANSVASLYGIT